MLYHPLYLKAKLVKNRDSIITKWIKTFIHLFIYSGSSYYPCLLTTKSLHAVHYAEHLKRNKTESWGRKAAVQRVDWNAKGECYDGGLHKVSWTFWSSQLDLAEVTGKPEFAERKVLSIFLHTKFHLLQMENMSFLPWSLNILGILQTMGRKKTLKKKKDIPKHHFDGCVRLLYGGISSFIYSVSYCDQPSGFAPDWAIF